MQPRSSPVTLIPVAALGLSAQNRAVLEALVRGAKNLPLPAMPAKKEIDDGK